MIAGQSAEARFEEDEHHHGAHDRDNNMRAAVIHVIADAAVSVLVIVGLILARTFGWLWMDPVAGIIGACSWSYGLIRDTGAILLDMLPSARTADRLRVAIEQAGDRVIDLHLWRLGPGHLGAIVAIATESDRDATFYRSRLADAFAPYHRGQPGCCMKSPGVDVCRFDRGTGWCIGCGRTLNETRKWRKTARPQLLAISAELPTRLANLVDRSSRSSD